jgi:hypothetical protein
MIGAMVMWHVKAFVLLLLNINSVFLMKQSGPTKHRHDTLTQFAVL